MTLRTWGAGARLSGRVPPTGSSPEDEHHVDAGLDRDGRALDGAAGDQGLLGLGTEIGGHLLRRRILTRAVVRHGGRLRGRCIALANSGVADRLRLGLRGAGESAGGGSVEDDQVDLVTCRCAGDGAAGGVRGPGGGYYLGKDAGLIDIAAVIEAVNESTDATRCQGAGDCQKGETCLTHHLWTDLSDQIRDFLGTITLADLVARQEVRDIACRQGNRLNSEQQTSVIYISDLASS